MAKPNDAEIQPLVDAVESVLDVLVDFRGPLFLPMSERGFLGFLGIVMGVPLIEVSVLIMVESANGAVLRFFEPEALLLSAGAGLFEAVGTASLG